MSTATTLDNYNAGIEAVEQVVAGAVAGFALSIPLTRLVGQEFTGAVGSPLVTAGVALLLILTALAATTIPAMRAARASPTQALRTD